MPGQISLREIAEILDQRLAEFKTAQDGRLDKIDGRLDQGDARHEQVMAVLREVMQSVGEQFDRFDKRFDQLKEDIIRENRTLAEQFEGRKIASLAEETHVHRDTLSDHEIRITELEEAAI